MLRAKFQDYRTNGSGEDDFKGFYHIWAWRSSWSSWSCDLENLYEVLQPLPKAAPHKIWL